MKARIIAAGIITGIPVAIGLFCLSITNPKPLWLTTHQVVSEFIDQGIALERNIKVAADCFSKGGVVPAIYDIEDSDCNLLIYEYPDSYQRNRVSIADFDSFDTQMTMVADTMLKSFAARNILVALQYPNEPDLAEIDQVLKLEAQVRNTVLYQINHAAKVEHQGDNGEWFGTITIEYYRHDNVDQHGNCFYEAYYRMVTELEHSKGQAGDQITNVMIKRPSGKTALATSAALLDQSGRYREVFTGHSIRGCHRDDFLVTFTWQGEPQTLRFENIKVTVLAESDN